MSTGNRKKAESPPIQAAADSLGKRRRPLADLRSQISDCRWEPAGSMPPPTFPSPSVPRPLCGKTETRRIQPPQKATAPTQQRPTHDDENAQRRARAPTLPSALGRWSFLVRYSLLRPVPALRCALLMRARVPTLPSSVVRRPSHRPFLFVTFVTFVPFVVPKPDPEAGKSAHAPFGPINSRPHPICEIRTGRPQDFGRKRAQRTQNSGSTLAILAFLCG